MNPSHEDVMGVFSDCAQHYDVMNDFMSFGVHRLWKKEFIKKVAPVDGEVIVDLSCGSGDLLIQVAKSLHDGVIYGIDPNPAMLNQARLRIAKAELLINKHSLHIKLLEKYGEDLSCLPDNSVDKLMCSFGIRNVVDRVACLREIYRILKPQGQVFILEFAQPHSCIAPFYKFYKNSILPKIGQHLFSDRASYEYLATSIDAFWDKFTMLAYLSQVGFQCEAQELSLGITCIYQGSKPCIPQSIS